MLERLKKFMFPGSCCLCDSPGYAGMDLCRNCLGDLPDNKFACEQCALPVAGKLSSKSTICGHCLRYGKSYNSALSPYIYAYPIDYFVQSLKFGGEQKYARLMGELIATHVATRGNIRQPEVLIPVPMHSGRYRERGFNQSALIAKYCGSKLRIPVAYREIKRIRETTPQSALSKSARKLNLRGAFSIESTSKFSHVTLIDDVMTTGSTAEAVAKKLKLAGVQEVDIWVFARAL